MDVVSGCSASNSLLMFWSPFFFGNSVLFPSFVDASLYETPSRMPCEKMLASYSLTMSILCDRDVSSL